MTIQITEKQLKNLIQDSVAKTFDAKFMQFGALLLPYVSKKEQKEIEKLYKKPARKISKSYFLNA